MLRKVSVVFTVFVVGLLLIGPQSFGVSDSATTNVEWRLESCWISIEINPNPKWLSLYNNYTPGTVVEDPMHPQRVTVRTSCKGYTLDVEPDSFDLPAFHKSQWDSEAVITDFKLKGEVTSGSVSCDIPNFENFASMNDSKQVLSTSNPRTTHTDMYYKYLVDKNDVEGDYTLTLIYTVSS